MAMRLDDKERNVILTSVLGLDPEAEVYLYGSRTDLNKRGGDIDLLIFSKRLTSSDKLAILANIFDQIEEQKIDLLIAKDTSDPFVRIALKSGVRL